MTRDRVGGRAGCCDHSPQPRMCVHMALGAGCNDEVVLRGAGAGQQDIARAKLAARFDQPRLRHQSEGAMDVGIAQGIGIGQRNGAPRRPSIALAERNSALNPSISIDTDPMLP